jgi:hypothetical protein
MDALKPNGGATPTNYFLSGTLFPNALNLLAGSTLGRLTNVGTNQQLDFPGRRTPHSKPKIPYTRWFSRPASDLAHNSSNRLGE